MALLASTLITDLQDQIGTLNAAGQAVLLKFIQRAVDRVYNFRRWTWRRINGQFTAQAPYTTGTVTVSAGSTDVTVAGGADLTSITDYDTGDFWITLNSEMHAVVPHATTNWTTTTCDIKAGVDTAVSAATYGIYRPEARLDTTLAELVYVGTYGQDQLEVLPPGECHRWYNETKTQTYAERCSLASIANESGTKYRRIQLWPFPSERRVYTYEGYIAAPTLSTSTDVGTPDDFRDVIEELVMARWYRTRQRDTQKAQECLSNGEGMLKAMWAASTKDAGPIPFMGDRRGHYEIPRITADTEIWR